MIKGYWQVMKDYKTLSLKTSKAKVKGKTKMFSLELRPRLLNTRSFQFIQPDHAYQMASKVQSTSLNV